MLEPEQQLKLLVQDRPWEGEPNEAEWEDDQTGYRCRISRHPTLLHLNGYVSVAKSHPAYGKTYDDVDVKIHGGLTYSHDDGGWWCFGFDCGHAGDLVPGVLVSLVTVGSSLQYRQDHETYRTWEYVENEVRHLVSELWRIENGKADTGG
jgi:hypothetical protein